MSSIAVVRNSGLPPSTKIIPFRREHPASGHRSRAVEEQSNVKHSRWNAVYYKARGVTAGEEQHMHYDVIGSLRHYYNQDAERRDQQIKAAWKQDVDSVIRSRAR